MRRTGFTLIELLMVVAIIAILASMIFAVATMMREAAKRSRTQAIQSVIQQALSLQGVKHGGVPSPAEHPLAGSREPRTAFVRAAGAHAAVATTGMALVGAALTDLSSGTDRLLLPDDLLADKSIPGLYGVPRSHLGILGHETVDVTQYRRIKLINPPIDPDDPKNYREVAPTETTALRESLLQFWLSGNTWSELVKLNAVYIPTDDDSANLLRSGRVWSPPSPDPRVRPFEINESGTWKPIRLRGASLVDGWGREMLFSITKDKAVQIESAGRDGFFRVNPGEDGVLQTDPWGPVAGDDRDGSHENVLLWKGD